MKKFFKWFGVFAAIGTAIGIAAAFFLKNSSDSEDVDGSEFTEDEDFDLDADLQPAEREYVSLHKSGETEAADAGDGDNSSEKDTAEESDSTETSEEYWRK